ncbi:MAG: aminotransferase class I/II-fold pyridoxal phosphate-dependent enzyme [Pelagibacteraceae bacterium TMED124]|nr:MAG: aminotransferase class I/II-fold pyridoxal phosphate-dependent enzyme [Pelagibacteraceae bacterium TMED124]
MQFNKKGLIKELKESISLKDAFIRSIDIDSKTILLPICKAHLEDKELIKDLREIKNEYLSFFPFKSNFTEEAFYEWFKNLLNDQGKILFLILNSIGKTEGIVGLSIMDKESVVEIDNFITGSANFNEEFFGQTINKLIEWVCEVLMIQCIKVRVYDNNLDAISFYQKNSFVIKEEIPLDKINKNDFISVINPCDLISENKNVLFMEHSKTFARKNNELLLTAGPSISQLESYYAFDAAKNGWNRNWSYYINKLEEEFAEYVGVKHAIATSSCTGALHIALLALDIGEGDEVIVPDQTWVATANAVKYTGAKPVFADIELNTWNIDPLKIESLITPKTRAIIPVHMYGNPSNMAMIKSIAKEKNLFIVEDAAPSIGAEHEGRKTGSFGEFGAFSFQGAKLMVTGEGGMLVTNNTDLYKKAYKIWDQGRNATASRAFWIDSYGVKYKMSNVQAAIGLGQLRRIDLLIDAKRKIFKKYKKLLNHIKCLDFIEEYPNSKSICWMTSFSLNKFSPISRDDLIKGLKENGIDSRPVFPAISQYPIWGEKYIPKENSLFIGDNGINLPSGVCLKSCEVEYVCEVIEKLLVNS